MKTLWIKATEDTIESLNEQGILDGTDEGDGEVKIYQSEDDAGDVRIVYPNGEENLVGWDGLRARWFFVEGHNSYAEGYAYACGYVD